MAEERFCPGDDSHLIERIQNVLWLSRHDMSEVQKKDLSHFLPKEKNDVEVEKINHAWSASEDADYDIEINIQKWHDLFDNYRDLDFIICGVFPPAAMEALNMIRCNSTGLPAILSPISKQGARIDGQAIEFVHLRWARV